ncbi:transporter substrate-binding domain-containing protein [Clostridium malenominatum]|uniref:histidine kinase n=1 Tax=Clostridium malenominatum TaxID=1539 RepID=A0ABN1INK4_9CLOT
MKKYFKALILFSIGMMILFGFNLFIYYKDKTEDKSSYAVVRVAGDENFPPFEYIDESGVYTGFNVDIIRAIALVSGVEVQFYPMRWEEACEKLTKGEIDLIQGMKYTTERAKDYDFTEGYIQNSQSIFVLENNLLITSYESLTGHAVAIQKGDVAINNLRSLKDVDVVFTNNQEEAFVKLLEGEVEAIICNTLTGVNYLDKLKVRNKIKIVDIPLNYTDYSIAIKKGDTRLLKIMNRGLREIKDNGTYETIYRKWFGNTNDYPTWYVKNIMKISLVGGMVFMIAFLLFYLWNDILKEEVKKQTYRLEQVNADLVRKNDYIKEEKDFREWILNSIYSGIITINSDGEITFINDIALKILKIKMEELINMNVEDTLINEIFPVGEKANSNELKEIYINERKIYINYRINIIGGKNQYYNETIISFRDITEEKLMHETIKTRDKMDSLGTLLSGIAHEIRNPLTSIKTYAELLPKKYENPKFREMISLDIPKEIERLNNLINDLLEYSKPRKPFKEEVSLLNTVESLLRLIKDKIDRNLIKINININEDIVVFIDKNQLRQVLINLMLNSIESMNKEEKIINIDCKIDRKGVILYLSDNGHGIDEKDMDKVYNPFFTTKATGTGLGLFVTYKLLMENGVDIQIESIKEVGTTFKLYFKKEGEDEDV